MTSFLVAVAMSFGAAWAGAADESARSADAAAAEAVAETQQAEEEYWIGVMASPVDELLKTHLKVDGGLVVQNMVPDSPAAKAGVQKSDILLKFNDTAVSDLETLAGAVRENRDKEATLALIRAGKPKSVKIKPAPRPAEAVVTIGPIPGGDWASPVIEMLKKLQSGQPGQDPLQMWFYQPGIVLPRHLPEELRRFGWDAAHKPRWLASLPEDTSITITKSGEGPAEIVVKRGEESWTVDEKQLDNLPEDLREPVRNLLDSGTRLMLRPSDAPRLQLRETLPAPGRHKLHLKIQPAEPGDEPQEGARAEGLNKRLEELRRQLRENQQRLEEQLEKLRRDLEDQNRSDA